ncbi:MAG: hypothetical protein ACPGID_01175 [Rubricella sp.]
MFRIAFAAAATAALLAVAGAAAAQTNPTQAPAACTQFERIQGVSGQACGTLPMSALIDMHES